MQYWFWVAKSDAIIAERGYMWGDSGPNVKPGDLSLIYRIRPYSFIEVLAKVISKPEPDCPIETQKKITIYGHCCEYEVLHTFRNPITFPEMIANPILNDWIGLKQNLQGMYFSMDETTWKKLNEKLKEKNPDYKGYEIFI
jgi:hypothetical protein